MNQRGERICSLAEETTRADDPEAALSLLTELRRELDALEYAQVRRGLAAGRSFGDLARALGISRQAAHRRYRDLAPPRRREPGRLAASDEARSAVRLAHAEMVAAGASAAGSRHLLLGILQTDSDAARALLSQGVTLEKARGCARSLERADDDPACLQRILRRAGRIALARGDSRLGATQLLLAAIADADGSAGRILAALGATPAAIRARLGC